VRWLAIVGAVALLACTSTPKETSSDGGGGTAGGGAAGGTPRPGPQALDGAWSELTPLSSPRTTFGAVAVGRSIHIVGGFIGAETMATSSVAAYDVDAPGEQPLSDLPGPTAGAAAFAKDGVLYVAGGIEGYAGDVIVPFDTCNALSGGAWATCADIGNGPTTHAAQVTSDDRSYLFGGLRLIDLNSGSYPTLVVQRYEPASDQWNAETMMPEIRDGAAVIIHEGVAHVIGGRTIDQSNGSILYPNEVLSYDFTTYVWSTDRIAPLPTGRASLSCASLRGFAYCFGGYDTTSPATGVVERLELSTGAWLAQPALPEPLSGVRAVALDDAVVVLGGRDINDAASARVHLFQ
jgi:N-acetylneuraminic acid mutarotase